MSAHYTAFVKFSNGFSAAGVTVRLFDRDPGPDADDDLTITPGSSDDQGVFTVEYDPGKFRDSSQVTINVPKNPPFDWTLVPRTIVKPDLLDTFQPYLQFSYKLNGKSKTFSANLNASAPSYTLPEIVKKTFVPSQHGWKFINAFSGYFLPIALPTAPFIGNPTSVYGLCGGMSAGANDFFLLNRPIPTTSDVPTNGTPIQRYLYHRQIDSFGPLGTALLRFVEWMGLPDGTPQGTQKLTLDEFTQNVKPHLDQYTPVPIGLVYQKWSDTHEIWQNHQVLAYAYSVAPNGTLRISVCDPNFPTRDDIVIEAVPVDVGGGAKGLQVLQRIGADQSKKLYGFFAMPYQPAIPPTDVV
jgi:hypothetical protein